MDKDVCCLKNRERMDINTVWQWRILHVKKYSRSPRPFHYCSKIGLDFNVGSTTHTKMDLPFVPNGVILEVCDFAKTLSKSKRYFIPNILENNFDLGFENEQQRCDFSAEIQQKLKDLIRKSPKDKHEVFTLFDTLCKPECANTTNNGLYTASTEYQPDSLLVEMEVSGEHEDTFKCSSEEKTEEMDDGHTDGSDWEDEVESSGPAVTQEIKENVRLPSFPCCEKIGLLLGTGSKQSLDPGLLTDGVMLELVDFTRVLTASFSSIIFSVLQHNFKLNLKSQQGRDQVWFMISQLLKRGKRCAPAGTKVSPEFENEPFFFEPNPLKRSYVPALSSMDALLDEVTKRQKLGLKSNQEKRTFSETSECIANRHRRQQSQQVEESMPSHHTDLSCSQIEMSDYCYMCPVEEDTDSENSGNEEHFEYPGRGDIFRESQSGYVDILPTLTTTDGSSSLTANTDVSPGFPSHPKESLLQGNDGKLQIQTNLPNECNMDQEQVGLESNMWKLRANRVKEILSVLDRENYMRWKLINLEFNVGYGPKRNLSTDLLTNSILFTVARFALAMSSSQQEFIMDILENNFDLGLQSKSHKKAFACEVMNRVRQLKKCEDAVKFSKEVFEIPCSVSSVNMAYQSMGSITPEPSTMSNMRKCEFSPVCAPNSPVENESDSPAEMASQNSLDVYPFCNKFGLKLHVNYCQPNKKLDINKLTKGAMAEVANFAEKLCGTFEQICVDVLRHNFDLQGVDFYQGRTLFAQIAAANESKNLAATFSHKLINHNIRDPSILIHCQNNAGFEACSSEPVKAIVNQNVIRSTDTEMQNDPNLLLWKLRTTRIQQILSEPHVEQCPLYSYPRCTKLGIDFNVASGVKRNLDPKLLTNGIMVELFTFVAALMSSSKEFMTEILEYNFDLNLNGELYRSAYAQKLWTQVVAWRSKRRKTPPVKLFELPDLRCLEEHTPYCPKCYQYRNYSLFQDESESDLLPNDHLHVMTDISPHVNCSEQKTARDPISTFPATAMTTRYCGYCKEVGLSLCVDRDHPKEKLDWHVLTWAVMNEVHLFSKKLCGTKYRILNDILEHNFNLDTQTHGENPAYHFLNKMRPKFVEHAWFNEVAYVQSVSCKDVLKNTGNENQCNNSTSRDISTESLSSCLDVHSPFLTNADGSSSSPTVNTALSSPCASQLEENLPQGHEQTPIPTNVPNECDVDPEEIGSESNMWKLRANRVKEILSVLDKELYRIMFFKKVDVKFDVGYGPKQQASTDLLTNSVLFKFVRFALAMSSSQEEFIMDILENNFDLGLQSKSHKKAFACEVMNSVRQLKKCEDAVKFSKEVFELPCSVSSNNMPYQSMGTVDPEFSTISKMRECGFYPMCAPDSSAETEPDSPPETEPDSPAETVSQNKLDLYPFCKETGLKLHVNYSQPDKLNIKKLTKGAMTEVANFAEKLCGTFEQIFVDVLRHNFDLDLQSADSDLARNILVQMPVVISHINLAVSLPFTIKDCARDPSIFMHCQNNRSLQTCSPDPAQAIIGQNVSRSTDSGIHNDPNLLLWKLRTTRIQQILSEPHVEQCPLYSYPRCKKLGIDFNVASGVKRNFDPKLLTNGIMVELFTFTAALISSSKEFMTEILEYNFDLNLNGELHRSAYARQLKAEYQGLVSKISTKPKKRATVSIFKLPDPRYIKERTPYCPKCYQDRNSKFYLDDFDSTHMSHGHPRTMTNIATAGANCSEQKSTTTPVSTFLATELMTESHHFCKKAGISLCVDRDNPKEKLDRHVLTWVTVKEMYVFAKKLCGTRYNIIDDILKHNFNLSLVKSPGFKFLRNITSYTGELTWFNEMFDPLQNPQENLKCKRKDMASAQSSKKKVTFTKRQLDLQTKKKRNLMAKQQSEQVEENMLSRLTDLCTSQTEDMDHYYMCPVEDTDSENNGNEDHCKNPAGRNISQESQSGYVDIHVPILTTADGSSYLTENTDMSPAFPSQPDGSPLQGDEGNGQIPTSVPNECDMDPEEMGTESNMWKLRAKRVKEILSVLGKERYLRLKSINLEFNVGYGPKQNLSADLLTNSVLFKVARFALAMSSSQQEFIMDILENNFDLGLQSKYDRDTFACDLINRVRQLKTCEDAVKFSKEIFELPGPTLAIITVNQSKRSVNTEPSTMSNMSDVAPDSLAEAEPDSPAETVLQNSLDLYPFCKKIGLKLHVNCSQPNKLTINKLTNGAMTEVANFAEKLCGTFEQICVDVLRHNFDLDLQSADSDLARKILVQIPLVIAQRNRVLNLNCIQTNTKEHNSILMHCQNNTSLEVCSSEPVQAIENQNVIRSTDTEMQTDPNLLLWKLRTTRIQQILSEPHVEQCPLYSYPRCKKLGIDFNVASGVKRNLDAKLLTNGIMVELFTIGTALMSSSMEFMTEILEYNFDLNLNSELYRSTYAQQLKAKYQTMKAKCPRTGKRSTKAPISIFELPDPRYIKEHAPYCPRCHQDRNYKFYLDNSHSGHMSYGRPDVTTDDVNADAICTEQKPTTAPVSTFPASDMITECYNYCKRAGVSLCVDRDHPKEKLDWHVLTCAVMNEVYVFSKKLCGTRNKIINDILEYNFNLDTLSEGTTPAVYFGHRRFIGTGEPTWFSEIAELQTPFPKEHSNQKKELSDVQTSEKKEVFRKRQLDMQTRKEEQMVPRMNVCPPKIRKKQQMGSEYWYPICSEIGLDLEVSSEMKQKEKLDLALLTTSVLLEIHKFLSKKTRHYYPKSLYDILDYNFDLSSQHHRSWEFSLATASQVYRLIRSKKCDERVFKLPFVFPSESKNSKQMQKKKHGKPLLEVPHRRMGGEERYVRTGEESRFENEDTVYQTYPWGVTEMQDGHMSEGNDSHLCGNLQIKEEKCDPHNSNFVPEVDTEEKYHPHDYFKTESGTEDDKGLVTSGPSGSFGNTLKSRCPIGENDIKREAEIEGFQYYSLPALQVPDRNGMMASCPKMESIIKTESDIDCVECAVPLKLEEPMEYCKVTLCQNTENTWIKEEEQENAPEESYQYEVHECTNAESTECIKHEC